MVGMRIFGGGGGRESKGVTLFPGAWCLFLFVYSREFPGIKRRCGFGGLILIASNPPYQQWVCYVYVLRFVLRLSPQKCVCSPKFYSKVEPPEARVLANVSARATARPVSKGHCLCF